MAQGLTARLIDQHPSLIVEVTPYHLLWRARKCDGPLGFNSIHDLVAPPAELVKHGRLNHEGKPILYVANSMETALSECDACPGDYFHLVGLIIPEKMRIRAAVIGEQFHSYRTGYMRHFGIDPEQTVFRNVSKLGHERGQRVFFTDSLLADVLTDGQAEFRQYVSTQSAGG